MIKNFLILIFLLTSFKVFSGFPQGDKEKMYKDKIEFKNASPQMIALFGDPTSSPVDAPEGTLGVYQSGIYRKMDAGLTANWERMSSIPDGLKYDTDPKLNLLDNPSFETTPIAGTCSNGCANSIDNTNKLDGSKNDFYHQMFDATGAGLWTYINDVATTSALTDRQGLLSLWIKTARENSYVCSRIDGADVDCLTIIADNKWRKYEIPMVFGATNAGYKIHSTDSNTTTILHDEVYLGLAPIGYVQTFAQASFVGKLDLSNNCAYSTSSTSYAKMLDSAPCDVTSITGSVSQNTNTLEAGIKITNFRTDGYYRIATNGLHYTSGAGVCYFSLSKTTSLSGNGNLYISGDKNSNSSLSADIRFSTGDTGEVFIIAKSSGVPTCTFYGTSGDTSAISVHFFPDNNSTIVTQNTELTAKTANDFVAEVSASGVVSGENFDWINGNCTNATPSVCTFNSAIFSNSPICSISDSSSSGGVFCEFNALSSTSASILCYNDAGTNYTTTSIKNITCTKSSTDYNKSATIIGKFENINSSDLVRVVASGNSSQTITTSTNIPIEDEEIDNYGAFSSGVFTAPKTSWYLLMGAVAYNTTISTYVDVYKNNTDARIRCNSDSTSAMGFTCIVPANKNDTITIRGAAGTLADNTLHRIQITELPDTESIVKNLSTQKTKCRTKFLTAAIVADGTVTDLTFNNLSTSKYYSLTMNTSFVYNTANNCSLEAISGITILRNLVRGADAPTDRDVQTSTNPFFKPTATTMTFLFDENTACTLEGNSSYNETWATLCELPDTFVNTTEF